MRYFTSLKENRINRPSSEGAGLAAHSRCARTCTLGMQAPLNVYAPREAETGLKAIGFMLFHFSLDAAVKGVAGWRGGRAKGVLDVSSFRQRSLSERRWRCYPPSLSFYAQVVRRRTHRSW